MWGNNLQDATLLAIERSKALGVPEPKPEPGPVVMVCSLPQRSFWWVCHSMEAAPVATVILHALPSMGTRLTVVTPEIKAQADMQYEPAGKSIGTHSSTPHAKHRPPLLRAKA